MAKESQLGTCFLAQLLVYYVGQEDMWHFPMSVRISQLHPCQPITGFRYLKLHLKKNYGSKSMLGEFTLPLHGKKNVPHLSIYFLSISLRPLTLVRSKILILVLLVEWLA